jgi:hypothetical protein
MLTLPSIYPAIENVTFVALSPFNMEELVNERPYWTWRMRVPGGWIYKDVYLEQTKPKKVEKVAGVVPGSKIRSPDHSMTKSHIPTDRPSDHGEIDMPTTIVDLGEHYQGAISLCCPQCGGDCLHHGRVTVFHRIEDDEVITQTVVTGPTATVEAVPNSRTTNPSSRRDGIEIEFQCELCHWEKNSDFANQRMFLRIAQHKGKTLLEWRFEDRETI